MRFANQGEWDRGLRMFGGIVLLAAWWGGYVLGALGLASVVVGVVALATGIVGWCPVYTACGVSTNRVNVGVCSNCESGHR